MNRYSNEITDIIYYCEFAMCEMWDDDNGNGGDTMMEVAVTWWQRREQDWERRWGRGEEELVNLRPSALKLTKRYTYTY